MSALKNTEGPPGLLMSAANRNCSEAQVQRMPCTTCLEGGGGGGSSGGYIKR